jgi:hypothetical protein
LRYGFRFDLAGRCFNQRFLFCFWPWSRYISPFRPDAAATRLKFAGFLAFAATRLKFAGFPAFATRYNATTLDRWTGRI